MEHNLTEQTEVMTHHITINPTDLPLFPLVPVAFYGQHKEIIYQVHMQFLLLEGINVAAKQLLPRGMIERYFPLNLLATVISCLSVQPRSEIT